MVMGVLNFLALQSAPLNEYSTIPSTLAVKSQLF